MCVGCDSIYFLVTSSWSKCSPLVSCECIPASLGDMAVGSGTKIAELKVTTAQADSFGFAESESGNFWKELCLV